MDRRPLDFHSIDEVVAELNRLQHEGYRKGGNWDLGQACNHLAIFIRGSLEGFSGPKLPWYVRLVAPFFVRWMIRKRRMPEGVKLPEHLRPPAQTDEAREVEELQRLLLRLKDHKGPLHPSPFGGDVGYDTWLQLQLIHCAHHLSFLHPTQERVLHS